MRPTWLSITILGLLTSQVAGILLFPDPIDTENDAAQIVSLGERNFDAAGNGITFPTTNQPLTLGQSYVFRFMTAPKAGVQWGTITVDLYLMAKGEHFITKLARIDPSQALEPLNVYSGTIPVTIPVNVGTGPLYFVRIYGLDKTTGSMFYLPDSSYFPIVNPYSGKWNHPAYSDSWVSGRTTLLNFILGEPFSTATTMRLEATGETMDKILIVNSSIPITEAMKGGVATTLSLSVPIPLDFSLNFYARLIPNDGPFASPKSIGAIGSPFLGFSLPTIIFTMFPSAVISNFNLQINITTPPQTTPVKTTAITSVFINNNITFTWKYTIPKPVVPSWNIDLYSGGDRSSMYMGKRLKSDLKATTYKWNIDEDIPSGLYFVRVWGYDTDGLKKMAEVDPISQISSVFNVFNPNRGPNFQLQVSAAPNWSQGCKANVTWATTFISTGVVFSVQGWVIDLYKNSNNYKFVGTLTPIPLDPSESWAIVDIPLTAPVGTDYFVRVRAVLNQGVFQDQDFGNITTWFKMNPAPAASKRNTTIANFPISKAPSNVTSTTTSKPKANYTIDPFANPNAGKSLNGISAILLSCLIFVFIL